MLNQLVSNAVKFTEKGSVIVTTYFFAARISGLEKEDKEGILQFIVHDTGIGMSKDNQQYLYEQLNSLEPSAGKGFELNIGQSLVKQFIANPGRF